MQNIQLRFTGSSNLGPVEKEVASLRAQFAALQTQLEASTLGKGGTVNVAPYKRAQTELSNLRTNFTEALQASGQFDVVQQKLITNTERLTRRLRDQKMGLFEVGREWRNLKEVYRQQMALQSMSVQQWKTDPFGRIDVDMIVPRDMGQRVMSLTDNLRLMNAALRSSSQHMIDWGKNTQWAGRQIMVGMTVPTTMFGIAAGAMAYQVESQMTRIQKVYDTAATDLAGQERELAQVRANSFQMASQAADQYGASIRDTLEVEANLAQTGLRGQDLLRATEESLRIATLGELDYQQSVNMTIALQNAFKLSTEELTNALNFMNSVENATSLSIADIAEATPRAASAMAGMNMSVQEMVILLTAMKERGVDAAEGANALKSGITRAMSPVPSAVAAFGELGINIEAISAQSGGNLLEILKRLGEELKDVDALSKQQALAELFGTYQFNRLNAALAGITDAYGGVAEESSQTARAVEVANQSMGEHAETARQELQRWQQSAPGQFKRALERIKAEIAEMGVPFLQIGSKILNFFAGLLEKFNALPDGLKNLALIGVVAAAAVGPLIMLAGIFANFTGQILKGITLFGGLAARFKIISAEERAQAIVAKAAASGFDTQAASAQVLTAQIERLTAGIHALNRAQAEAAVAAKFPLASQVSLDKNGILRNQSGQFASAAQTRDFHNAMEARQVAREMDRTAIASNVAEEASEKAARNWKSMAANAAIVGGSIGMMINPSNELLNILSQAALVAGLIGPNIFRSLKPENMKRTLSSVATSFGDKLKNVFQRASASATGLGTSLSRGGVKGALSGITSITGKLVAGFARLAGPAGLLVTAGFLAYNIYNSIKKTREEQEKLNNSAQDWANILGYTYQTMPTVTDPETGEQVKSVAALAEELRKANKPLVERLQTLRETADQQELLNALIREGLKVTSTGGTAAQAEQAVQAAMAAAGLNESQREELMIEIRAQVNFEDMKSQVAASAKVLAEEFNRIAQNEFDQSGSESFVRFFSGSDELNVGAKKAAEGVVEEFWRTFNTADEADRKQYFDDFASSLGQTQEEIFNKVAESSSEALEAAGIDTAEEFFKKYNQWANAAVDPVTGRRDIAEDLDQLFSRINGKTEDSIKMMQEAERTIARMIGERQGLDDDAIDKIQTLDDVSRHLAMTALSTEQAQRMYNDAIAETTARGEKLTDEQKLAVLNYYRAKAGLDAATSATQGFGNAAANAAGDVATLNSQLNEITGLEDADWVGAAKDAFSQTMDDIYAEADRIFDDQMNADLDRIANQGEARLDALDRQAEAREAEFEARQEAMESQFDAQREAQEAKWDAAMRAFDKRWDDAADAMERKQEAETERHEDAWERRIKAEEEAFDARIQHIEDTIEAERTAEELRQKIFEAEQTRIERMANMFNRNIDFNIALNSGDLDEAAKLVNDAQAEEAGWALDDASESSKTASDLRIEALEAEMEKVEEAKDKRLEVLRQIEEAEREALQDRQEAERKAFDERRQLEQRELEARRAQEQKMLEAAQERQRKTLENERQNYQRSLQATRNKVQEEIRQNQESARKSWEAKRNALNMELRTLKAFIPQNEQQLQGHIGRVQGAYGRFGVDLKSKGNAWSQYIANSFTTNLRVAGENLKNQVAWDRVGAQIAAKIIAGAFGMTPAEFANWIVKGTIPKGGISGVTGGGGGGGPAMEFHHKGGMIGGGGSRTGIPGGASRYPSEVDVRAKLGEYIMPRSAVNKYGVDFMESIRNGDAMGGPDMGMAGLFGAMAAGVAKAAINTAIMAAMQRSMATFGNMMAGEPGTYGGIKLNGEQLKNASTIMSVGRGLGASSRDLIIALMTAMQESTLRNLTYGDRDSVGLFQQRNAWGSFEDRTNPSLAARMFFLGGKAGQRGLLDFKNRDKMSLTQAAQAVQVSAFPNAYAKWEAMARAIVGGASVSPGVPGAAGQFRRPLNGRVTSRYGMRKHPITGKYKLHDGTDIAAARGTEIKAAAAGTVARASMASGYGNWTIINHAGGVQTAYAHQDRMYVRPGQSVNPLQGIGTVGMTGYTTGPHLHFMYGKGGKWLDPANIIPGLAKGGEIMFDNTIANLHKKETVLTAPLSQDLKEGIKNLDSSGGNEYNIEVTVNNPASDLDVQLAVERAIQNVENRKGRSRRMGDSK